MNERTKYEKPILVDMRSDSALGYTACSVYYYGSCESGSGVRGKKRGQATFSGNQ